MRVLVCGGRKFADVEKVDEALSEIHKSVLADTMLVIQGGASGADALARAWCMKNFVDYKNYPAEWQKYGRAAGPIRNQRMIEHGQPDLVLVFKGGRGTADMARRAEANNIPVQYIEREPA